MRANVKRVLAAFREGRRDRRDESVWTDGESIYSYRTCIVAALPSGRLVVNVTKYSATTSNKQSDILWSLGPNVVATVTGMRMGVTPSEVIDRANTLEAAAERAARATGAI